MKAKLELIASVTYEIDKEDYPAGWTDEQCVEHDVHNYEEEPERLLDAAEEIKVNGIIVPDSQLLDALHLALVNLDRLDGLSRQEMTKIFDSDDFDNDRKYIEHIYRKYASADNS